MGGGQAGKIERVWSHWVISHLPWSRWTCRALWNPVFSSRNLSTAAPEALLLEWSFAEAPFWCCEPLAWDPVRSVQTCTCPCGGKCPGKSNYPSFRQCAGGLSSWSVLYCTCRWFPWSAGTFPWFRSRSSQFYFTAFWTTSESPPPPQLSCKFAYRLEPFLPELLFLSRFSSAMNYPGLGSLRHSWKSAFTA